MHQDQIDRITAALHRYDREFAERNAEDIGGIYRGTRLGLLTRFVREVREALTPELELSGEELLAEHGHRFYGAVEGAS